LIHEVSYVYWFSLCFYVLTRIFCY
jgi:hypothetical protein